MTGGTNTTWQPINTAPKDGTEFWGCSLDPARLWPERLMKWGVASRPEEQHVCNDGEPWFINPEGTYLVPAPTHWKPK